MNGVHLSEFILNDHNEDIRNELGQTLWDFYLFQIHGLKKVQADPHPGNFLVNDKNQLIAIDFGCVKVIPNEFYFPYFELSKKENLEDEEKFEKLLNDLEILLPSDTLKERLYFRKLFNKMMHLFTLPLQENTFDFNDNDFWNNITNISKILANDDKLRQMNGNRGSEHFIYMNRTFFGLYHLLHDLKAVIKTENFRKYLK